MPPRPAGGQEVHGGGGIEGLARSERGRGKQPTLKDDEVTIPPPPASTADNNRLNVTDEPHATLQRHSSLIIPSTIPTQEILQNLSRYRSKGRLPSVEDNDNGDGDHEDEGEYFPPGQKVYYSENSASMGSSHADLSPIIPSSTPPPPLPISEIPRVDGWQRHTPPRRQTLSKKAAPKPKGRDIDEIDDSDPIMDFDDSDGEGHTFHAETEKAMEADPVVSSLQPSFPIQPRSASTHRRSPQRVSDDLSHRHPLLGPPESPSRRFVIPTTTLPIPRSHHQLLPPNSPTKRLRPVSEIPRPAAPPFFGQTQKSPGRRGKGIGSPSRRQVKTQIAVIPPATAASSPGKGTAMTPTKNVTAIGKSFKNLQPPPALGPRLQEIADEEARERTHTQDRAEQSVRKRRRQEKGKDPVRNNDGNSLLAGLSFELERRPPSPLYHGPSPPHDVRSPEPTPPAKVYPPSLLSSSLASYASSSEPTAAVEVDLKKQSLLAEVAAMRKCPQSPKVASAAPSPTLATQTRIKKEEPLTQVLATYENTAETRPTFNAATLDDNMEETRVTLNKALIDESMAETKVQVKPALLLSPPTHSQHPPQIQQSELSPQYQLPQPLQPPQPARLSYLQPKSHQQQPQQVGKDSSKANVIALPQLILEYASKLTPIDLIKWPPAKAGRFHILGLTMSIGPEDQIVTKTGQTFEKRQLSLCDQSATSFQVELWRERCKWADIVKAGDVILITDIQMKEYRQKIKGNTTAWSKMSRLDGSVLGSYQGNTTVESYLKIFIIKRRILALDLLDKDRGIARDPSFYLTQSLNSLPNQATTGAGAFEQDIGYESPARLLQRTGEVNVRSGREGLMPLLSAVAASAAVPHHAANTVTAATGKKPLLQMLPPSVTGSSIRASVVYKMLLEPGGDSQGWEVGAVMSNGRLVKVRIQSTAAWINDASPGGLLHFFGRFQDKSDVFHIDASSREPYSLSDNTWGNSMKKIEPLKLSSIRFLHEHKFMG
ncbi:hypothetical protein EDD21DRAFT_387556, partial [Dissophora ornata]